jgi:hypothetical protein
MPFVVILVGVILVVAAWNETHGDLGKALQADVPGYFKWGAALAAIAGLGFVPGLKTPSRWLLALVLLVIFLHNYNSILAGFKNFAQSGAQPTGTAGTDPTAAYTANPTATPLPTESQIAGEGGGGGGAAGGTGTMIASASSAANTVLANPTNPQSYITALESGFGGASFGGAFGTA